jgi:2,3-bisphosphoglycerate-dependent phosphoglycerate mutase
MGTLVLLRHGQSVWNLENRFTGWTDVDLADQGVREAHEAGALLKAKGYGFDVAYASVLKRAVRTLWIVLDALDLMWIPVRQSWRLNERHYGALQGLSKAAAAETMDPHQVFLWRRSFEVRPPALDRDDPRHPRLDPRYREVGEEELPDAESLQDTLVRVLPFWSGEVVPRLREGKRVLISAHGNSLRALVKYLDQIPEKAVPDLNIPTGIPLAYELDEAQRPTARFYLGKPEVVEEAMGRLAASYRKICRQ